MFKRLKNVENAQKNFFRDDDNESICNTPKSQFDDKYKKNQQTNIIDTKPQNGFDYLKSLCQEAKDMMDEVKNANDDINIHMLAFVGSDGKKFNFNTFRMLLDFLSAIYNGEISLKEAEISQRNLEKKIEELKFGYRLKNEKEKEEKNGVSMQANDLLEYRDKIIDAFKDGTFSSECLKKSDDATHDYVLEDVNDLFRKLNLWKKKLI